MACLKKIAQDLAFDCANPGLISGIAGVEEAVILNYEDVSSISVSSTTGQAVVTMKAGTRGIYRSICKKLYSSDGGIAGKRQCSYYVGNISSHETSFIVTCS